ncbi:hypothetical protein RB595_006135 [Gaeumannomyces hyphopodioides]
MADDGMLLNFEIGDEAFKPQVKFKGGRWRDRVRAQKSAKRGLDGGPARGNETGDGRTDAQRPAKRQRLGGDGGDAERRQQQGPGAGARSQQPRSQHVTSRLFSANPTALTNFDEKPTAEEPTEPLQASNAPLSDEAATFHALGLSRRIAQHLSSKLEMKVPTSIQKNTVPQLIKDDSDAFLQAQTGSGKTLAYLLPIVSRILALSENQDGSVDKEKHKKINRNSGLFAIILAPTRELCKQIATVLEKILRCTPWIVGTTVIGGESKHKEKARLRKGVNILVATPGRLTDHLDHSKMLDVGTVRWLVLDEGDRLMEMGFEEDLRTIVAKIRKEPLQEENKDGVVLGERLPKRRVTVLCSATMKMNVQKLGEISLVDAVHITAAAGDGDGETAEGNDGSDVVFTAPSQLKQSYLIVPAKLRLVTLIALLKSSFARKGSVMKAIIFISCADSVDFHFSLLRQPPDPSAATPVAKPLPAGDAETSPKKPLTTSHTDTTVAQACYISSPANPSITLHRLHGSLSQPVRTATLQAFTTAKDPAVLVTTDISSRGLDVPAVDLVIEYDPSFSVADHVHRIGRTARAGRPGKAMLFLQPGCEEGYMSLLHSANPVAPQLYETVLQAGLASDVDLPPTPPLAAHSDGDDDGDDDDASAQQRQQAKQHDTKKKQTWTSRAEALQLHLEQRLLASDAPASAAKGGKKSGSKHQQKHRQPKPPVKGGGGGGSTLLDAARQAFRSHIRAYATHIHEERRFFDITQLHLGHTAKSFGLREAPTGIGSGVVQRRAHKGPATPSAAGGKNKSGGGGRGSDDEGGNGVDEEALRRMKTKMKMVGSGASEFNIG